MRITWGSCDKLGAVATVTHSWQNVTVGRELIDENVGRLARYESDGRSALGRFLRELFVGRIAAFPGQCIDVGEDGVVAQVLDVGEAYDAISSIEQVIKAIGSSRKTSDEIAALLRSYRFGVGAAAAKTPNPFILAGRKRGFDVIRKDPLSGCFDLRNKFGDRMTLMEKSTFTDRTGYIATQLSTMKMSTMTVLSLAGLPVPRSLLTRSVGDAVDFHERSPAPSVVKPVATDFGIAVFTNLRSANEVAAAYRVAEKHGAVLVQEHVEGDDYRILVVDGVVAGITHRWPFSVTGDGMQTIEELASAKIAARAVHEFYRNYNRIDLNSPEIAVTLRRQGLTLKNVLQRGAVARLRDNTNVSSGGEHEEVDMRDCHRDNLQMAIDAAAVIGLDLAGIDFLSLDISKSWRENGGKICEINPTPAISVAAGADLLMNRLDDRDAWEKVGGDVLFITNRSKDGAGPEVEPGTECDQDLDELTPQQYFYQTYLGRKSRNLKIRISLDRLLQYGCPNRHVSVARVSADLPAFDDAIPKIRSCLPPDCRIAIGD